MKILILGGYGVFGGRLAEQLADIASLELLICGRDGDRAKTFSAAFPGPAAVLREFAEQMEVVTVGGGIAPSPYAGIGLNVMRAVVGYAGAPVKLQRGGRPGHGIGLAESRRYTIAVPGKLPLRAIRFSLVDVPDLQVIPPEHPAMTDI